MGQLQLAHGDTWRQISPCIVTMNVIARMGPQTQIPYGPDQSPRLQILVILADSLIDDAININTGKLCVLNKYEKIVILQKFVLLLYEALLLVLNKYESCLYSWGGPQSTGYMMQLDHHRCTSATISTKEGWY